MTTSNQSDTYYTIKKDFPTLLNKCMGIVSKACEAAGISRETYYRWRKEDPEWAALCDESNEYVIDRVENVLLHDKILLEKDSACTIFFLKTRGKNRGYIERKEHSGPDGQPIQQEVIYSEAQSRNAEMIRKITGSNDA